MKKNKIIMLIPFILIIIIIIIGYQLFLKNNNIPDNYIAIFHGGSGEETYSTYIYKIKNDSTNYGFQYINTKNYTTSWSSSKRKIKIIKKGQVNWTNEVFVIAEKNNSYDYVELQNGKSYTIEEFKKIFLMN